MGFLQRTAFPKGWVPDADSVNGPVDGLLRADNSVLDELGAITLRPGSTRLSLLADLDVHSLFTTANAAGTRYRFAGAGDNVYVDGSVLSAVTGSGDVAFGTHLGQVLFARNSTTKKYDGTTLRNWGLAQTGGAPTIAAIDSDGKTFATCDQSDAEFTIIEDDGTGITYAAAQDGTANGSVVLHPDTTTNRGAIQKLFVSETDFTSYDMSGVGSPNDLVQLYFYIDDPGALLGVTLMVDVNGDSENPFQDDYYWHTWSQATSQPLLPASQADIPTTLDGAGTPGARVRGLLPASGIAVPRDPASTVRFDKPVSNSGWSRLSVRREDMQRIGSTSGKDWKTVKAIRLVVETIRQASTQFDTVRINANPLSGDYKWCYVLAYNSSTYVGLSGASPLSDETQIQAGGATVTVPADGGRDGQANEIWLYRMGGVMDDFYRVSVKTGVSGGGSIDIDDTMSDIDAMVLNLKLQRDNGPPPSNIIGIAGPYYDRTFVLTSDGELCPSRRLNPDSFADGQVITVAGSDEQVYWVKKTINGLFIGTSKDVYVLEGKGAELPDGTIDFSLGPLNIDHPPISAAVAVDGNLVIYLANDGWRTLSGAGSTSLSGATSLLYRGQARHGVNPIDLTGRFRACIGKGQLLAITPEAPSHTESAVIYRQVPTLGVWYRHTYPTSWRSLHTEPDGTILAGDTAGGIWQLDSGTGDNGATIALALWTKHDDNGAPFQRKDAWDLRLGANTSDVAVAVALHYDGSDTAGTTKQISGGTDGQVSTVSVVDDTLTPFRLVQFRIEDGVYGFKLSNLGLAYREHPLLQVYANLKPQTPSIARRRFGGFNIVMDTMFGNASVVPVLDGVDGTAQIVNTSQPISTHVGMDSVVGRDLWAKITLSTGFEFYALEPLVLETLPPQMKGVTPRALFGSPGVKTISGIQLRLCTLGVAVTVTLYIDGNSVATFSVTSGADDPIDYTFAPSTAYEGVEFSLSFSSDVELYSWSPIVTARRPLGVTRYDSGPIDLGDKELVWIRHAYVKARATAPLSVTAYLDGRALYTGTTTPAAVGSDTIVPIDFGRGVKGRQPRLVITSTGYFYPYWIKVTRRVSGLGSEKPTITVALPLETGST